MVFGLIARLIEGASRSLSDMTPFEDAAAIVSAAVYHSMEYVDTPVGRLQRTHTYQSPIRGNCACLYVGPSHTFLAFRGTDPDHPNFCGDMTSNVGVAFGGSVAHAPWASVVPKVVAEARARGHRLTFTGHSLGGVQAAANFTAFGTKLVNGGDMRLEVFNCGSGLGNIIIGQLLPVDAAEHALFAATGSSCRSTHHHILGDVISSGAPLVALTKTYRQQEGSRDKHTIANFIAPNRWSELKLS